MAGSIIEDPHEGTVIGYRRTASCKVSMARAIDQPVGSFFLDRDQELLFPFDKKTSFYKEIKMVTQWILLSL